MKVVGARYNNYTNHLPQSKTVPTLSCFIILACFEHESGVEGWIFLLGQIFEKSPNQPSKCKLIFVKN